MKKISKLIIWIGVILALIFLALSIAVALFGKSIALSQLEKNFKRRVTLESINISFPLSVSIRKLDIQDLVRIDALYLKPSILGFLAGKVVLNEASLIRPEITLVMDEQGKLNLPQAPAKSMPILLAGLDIKDGKLIFIDKKIEPGGYKVIVNNINAKIHKASFPPASLFTRFNLSASLGESPDTSAGLAWASGWIDFGPKDMEGKFELKRIDLTYLAPYYSGFISDKKLTSGKLNFVSDLKSVKNELTAKCKAEFTDLVYLKEVPAEGEEPKIDLVRNVLNLFSNDTGRIAFDFTIRTKLDNPRINMKELRGVIGMAAVQNIAEQPPDKLKENIKDIEKQFKDIGKTFKEIFKKKEE